MREPGLELVDFHCRPGDDVERSVRQLFSAMRSTRRDHGKFLTEVHLTFDSDPVTAFVDDALDAACAATAWPTHGSSSKPVALQWHLPVSRHAGSRR